MFKAAYLHSVVCIDKRQMDFMSHEQCSKTTVRIMILCFMTPSHKTTIDTSPLDAISQTIRSGTFSRMNRVCLFQLKFH